MSEAKDPTIKLFGKTIPLPELTSSSGGPISVGATSSTTLRPSDTPVNESLNQDRPYSPEDSNSNILGEVPETDKASSVIKLSDAKQVDGAHPITSEEMADPNSSALPSADNEAWTSKTSKTEEDRNESSNSQDKTLKKPDKILPCPRCNSMDTKFCYFNNYNANQPRHFCKNCQRYWTAGGTMRNVPVGAGPRKNKNSASRYRHIVVPEALPNGVCHPNLKPDGSILTFGSDTPICESMDSVLNIEEKTIQNHAQNGFVKPEERRIPVSYGGGEKRGEHSSQSCVISANSKDEAGKNVLQDPRMQNCHSFPPQIPCFPGAACPYLWNSAQWTPLPIQTHPNSGPNSQTLGKHSRDENMLTILSSGEDESEKGDNTERCFWIPKTLRIDDKGDSISKGSLFKAFISKGDEKNHTSETSSV